MNEHHRRMIRYSLKPLVFLEQELFELDDEILRHITLTGLERAVHLLETLPGVQQGSAVSIVAEIGADMSPFPSAAHLSSWPDCVPAIDEVPEKTKAVGQRVGIAGYAPP
jgi:transposase